MSGHFEFKVASEEVGSNHAAFGLGHLAFAHQAFPEHLAPGHDYHAEAIKEAAAESAHYIRHQHAEIGHGIALQREQNEHVNAVAKMNMLMLRGRIATGTYADAKGPTARIAANTPMQMPAHMLKAAWLDAPAPRG